MVKYAAYDVGHCVAGTKATGSTMTEALSAPHVLLICNTSAEAEPLHHQVCALLQFVTVSTMQHSPVGENAWLHIGIDLFAQLATCSRLPAVTGCLM